MNYTEIKTFEDACKAQGVDANVLPDVSMLPAKHQKSIIAHYKLMVVVAAINGSWVADWSNRSQYKYEPWFKVIPDSSKPSGFGLSSRDYDSWSAGTYVGSRLCFETSEQAEYAGTQFKELYEDYLA
jgi:hypothetical protein